LSYYRTDFDETGSAEAAVRLALVDPNSVTGRTIGHVDVLNGSFRPFEVTAAALG
jgi:7-alpha-hydroxysteroid dehydrogenase